MADPATPLPLKTSRADQIFPMLTAAQMRRMAAHGRPRSVPAGNVLIEQGDNEIPIFLVTAGELEAVRPSCSHETLITIVGPGQFTGEVTALSGRRALNRIRARQASEVVELSRENVMTLVQT